MSFASDLDVAYLDVAAALAAQAQDRLSAETYISDLLQRAAKMSAKLPAFVTLAPKRAIAQARRADRRRRLGLSLPPLHGIPFAVKDLIDVRGAATRAQSRLPAAIAKASAPVVIRLERQGGICLGKLALEEFGIGSPLDDLAWPSPANPWDLQRSAGGSSSGSAVALSAGPVPLALGTDTGGSVRAPAAYCGLVGLKPTNGRIDLRRVVPLSPTLDTVGAMARSAEDCRRLFMGLVGTSKPAATGPSSIGVLDLRTARRVPDADVMNAFAAALSCFGTAGHHRADFAFPSFERARDIGGTILHYEAHQLHAERLSSAGGLYGRICRERLESGANISLKDYTAALAGREELRSQVDRLFDKCDLLALPVTFGAAPRLDDPDELSRSGDVSLRIPFNVTGHPSIAFCTGFNAAGLPLSMQLVGRRGEDERLLDAVALYQQRTPWRLQRPLV